MHCTARGRGSITNSEWTAIRERREDVSERERHTSKEREKQTVRRMHKSRVHMHAAGSVLMCIHMVLPWTVSLTTLLRPEPIPLVIWHRYDAESERVTALTAREPF